MLKKILSKNFNIVEMHVILIIVCVRWTQNVWVSPKMCKTWSVWFIYNILFGKHCVNFIQDVTESCQLTFYVLDLRKRLQDLRMIWMWWNTFVKISGLFCTRNKLITWEQIIRFDNLLDVTWFHNYTEQQ